MIKFFRIFRYKLLKRNKISNYLVHATGEIILVVIGIIIAISLNNSNQSKIQSAISEKKLLKLRQLIHKDSLNIAQTIAYSKSQIVKIQTAIDLFGRNLSKKDYHIIMSNLMIGAGPRTKPLDRSIYEEMLNSGEFSNIQDADLKQRIAAYYAQYEHFLWIIKTYIEDSEYSDLRSKVYLEDIVRKSHSAEIIRDQESQDGYLHFKNAIRNMRNYGSFENYAFSSKQIHELIILYHEILKRNYLNGLAVNPNVMKG